MDDIYFSDKRRRRPSGEDGHLPKERFTHSNHFDIEENPTLKKRTSASDGHKSSDDFAEYKPDEYDVYRDKSPVDRTPKGKRPINPSDTISRTPSGRKVTPPADKTHVPPPKKPVSQPSRTPGGSPVKPDKDEIKKKIILAVSAVVLLLIVGIFGYGYYALGNIDYDNTITENAYIDESELESSPDVENILIIGSDSRSEDNPEHELVSGQRADSMILFSIDKKNKQIKLTSFLRDCLVYIPSEGYEDKLNAAYSIGGPQLTMDTIEYNFGVKIDRYLIINFEVFKQFINLLGGIPVEVSDYEADYMVNELQFIYIKPGVNVMNGNASLMYCRMRYLDNDLYRTQRQRKVIKAVVGKVAKTNLFKLMSIVRQVVPNIRTDISRNELISLGAGAAIKFLHYDIVQQQIPAEGTWWDESIYGIGDVIVFNAESNEEALKEFVFEKYVEEKKEEE